MNSTYRSFFFVFPVQVAPRVFFFSILRDIKWRFEARSKKGDASICWRQNTSWIWTQAAHFFRDVLPLLPPLPTAISCSLIFLPSTTSLLPAWGRSMHVLYSGPVASSVSSSHLFLSSFSSSSSSSSSTLFLLSSSFLCTLALGHK